MQLNFDAVDLRIPCPGCGKEIEETLGRLKNDPVLTCPSCGQKVAINAEGVRTGTRAVEESLDELRRSLRKLGK